MATKWKLLWIGTLAVAVIAAGGAAFLWRGHGDSGIEDLQARDDRGGLACFILRQWLRGEDLDPQTGKPYSQSVVSGAVGNVAKDALTPTIRGAVGQDAPRLADLRRVRDACADEGVDMPVFAPPIGA